MKRFEFSILPRQLYSWARQHHQLPVGVEVGQRETAELLFTALFPNVSNYSIGYSPGSSSYSCDEKDCKRGERSVEVGPFYRRAGSKYLEIMNVRIVDTENGIEAALASIKNFGLLGGEELIETGLKELRVAQEQKMESERRNIRSILLIGVLLLAAAAFFALK